MRVIWLGSIVACGSEPDAAPDVAEPHPPTMHAEAFVLDEGTNLCATVSAADPDGDAVRFNMVTEPKHGSVQLDATGHFLYVPNPDYAGSDSFTVVATDGAADSDETTVELTILPRPASPPTD